MPQSHDMSQINNSVTIFCLESATVHKNNGQSSSSLNRITDIFEPQAGLTSARLAPFVFVLFLFYRCIYFIFIVKE